MKAKTAILVLLFLMLAGTAFWLQHFHIRAIKETPYRDSLYLPHGKQVNLMAIGYDQFLADFLWLRAIQAFGGYWRAGDKVSEAVYNYFDVISDLSPHFIEVYKFGNLVMGDEGGDYERALTFLEKGQRYNWRNR